MIRLTKKNKKQLCIELKQNLCFSGNLIEHHVEKIKNGFIDGSEKWNDILVVGIYKFKCGYFVLSGYLFEEKYWGCMTAPSGPWWCLYPSFKKITEARKQLKYEIKEQKRVD